MPTPIVYGELLYTCSNQGVLTAYNAKTGERVYQERLGGTGGAFTASPVASDGKIYLSSEDGDVFVVKAGPTAWPDGTPAELYSFRHDLYRELLYDRLPATRRAVSHARVGRRLEAAWSSRLDAIAAELAEHFDRGNEPVRAIPHHQRAGQLDRIHKQTAPPGFRDSQQRPLAPGEVVASTYAIRDEITRTDDGIVFEARDMMLDRPVAFKLAWRDPGTPSLIAEARRCAAVPQTPRPSSIRTQATRP